MFGEIVAAGIVLMLVWWLFKSGLIWQILGLLFLLILVLLFVSSVSAEILQKSMLNCHKGEHSNGWVTVSPQLKNNSMQKNERM